MARWQQNVDRFAGRFMIQDRDHMSGIVPVREKDARDSERNAQRGDRGQNVRRLSGFEYENPREYH